MTNLDSPSVDSPATPINVASAPHVKIDTDFNEESDARHEPIPLKLEQASKIDQGPYKDALFPTVTPEVFFCLRTDVIVPIDPRHETPPGDVEMQEQGQEDGTTPPVLSPFPSAEGDHDQPSEEGAVDAHGEANGDVKDEAGHAPLPPTSPTPGVEEGSQETNADADESNAHLAPEDQPHPAKRARKHSDADAASVISNPTPPPASAPILNGITAHSSPPNPTPTHTQPPTSDLPGTALLTQAQYKFCVSTLKNLRKSRDARPFLVPVDIVVMNIPHYPEIVTHPMDFSTIEDKLKRSNPSNPDSNPEKPRYKTADQFIADVRLVFTNCVKFNGPEHTISLMGRRLEELFDKSIKNLPPPEEAKPAPVKKAPPPAPAPPPATTAPAKQRVPRRPSTSTPVIRRNESVSAGGNRPKREIHPPPSKDLPYADVPKKSRKARAAKDNLNAEQLKFCSKLLSDLHRKTHWNFASPFYEPVDWVSLGIPSYPKIIKEPMDLSTMRKKLDSHEYPNAQAFFADFKLMIRNCFHFNPPGTPVNMAGIELQRIFDDKWKNLPQSKPQPTYDDDMDAEDDDSEDDNQHRIAEMEKQIEAMRGTISALKQQKKEKPPKKAARQQPAPTPSSSKPAKAAASSSKKATTTKKSGKKSAAVPGDDDVLTFEQKKDLSEAIQTLDGQKLERVIQIIHEGVPEIRDSTEEIELEIDLLPANVLTKLYNFVIRPLKAAQPKRARTGKGTGTGGLKRKSMDEDVEAEKIRALEARMALFEKGTAAANNGGAGHVAGRANGGGSDRSSDSSDSSDSGSDSE
ncbi:Bromodomain-containing protein [Thelephora ganbajun]|uniref:Bromodomain-containing protein n=1 Tax=Thelephora ganbajun TaxID=370292 RepID=A0ACB6ZIB9_THEGA|nr:Bromodomain-containing protein [Thelephora ganbajun]